MSLILQVIAISFCVGTPNVRRVRVLCAVGVSRKLHTKHDVFSKFKASMSARSALEFWWSVSQSVSEWVKKIKKKLWLVIIFKQLVQINWSLKYTVFIQCLLGYWNSGFKFYPRRSYKGAKMPELLREKNGMAVPLICSTWRAFMVSQKNGHLCNSEVFN